MLPNSVDLGLRFLAGNIYGLASGPVKDPIERAKLLHQALDHFEFVFQRNPGNPDVSFKIAMVYSGLRQFEESQKYLRRALRHRSFKPPKEYFELLLIYALEKRDKQEAMRTLRFILAQKEMDGLEVALNFLREHLYFKYDGKLSTPNDFKAACQNDTFLHVLEALLEELEKYPKAQPKLENIYARMIFYIALTCEKEKVLRIASKIQKSADPQNLRAFAQGLEEIRVWLSRQGQSEEVRQWIFEKIAMVWQTLGFEQNPPQRGFANFLDPLQVLSK